MNFNRLDYALLTKNLSRIVKNHAFVHVFSCGKSVMGRDILCVRFGKGKRKIFLNGAHHALEWITASLLNSFVSDYAVALRDESTLGGHDILDIYERATFYVMPMVNPDGVDIVLNGINRRHERFKEITSVLKGEKVGRVWQANINGVDLNHNYDAMFYEGRELQHDCDIHGAAPTRFFGNFPFSEPETRAVRDLVRAEHFDVCVAFHAQGEVIYWDFNGMSKYREQAERLARASGYALDTAEGISSCSGFKDWVIEKFDIPAFTVEVGKGKNPIPFSQFDKIKSENYRLIAECCYL